MEVKLLLPLHSLALGPPSHAFRNYFQMSESLARQACFKFDYIIDVFTKMIFTQT